MTELYDAIQESAAAVQARLPDGWSPQVALILGSGLGSLAEAITPMSIVPYPEIPHFRPSTVPGHAGRLVVGDLEGCRVAAMQGRYHFYEGYSMQEVAFPVRVLRALGCAILIVSNAAGGINPEYRVGDLMLIADDIFIPGLAGHHPLRGPNDERLGVRFLDTKHAYDASLRQLARNVAKQQGLTLREGIYCMLSGPTFESQGELRMLHRWGADAVGMSTVPEVVVALHSGMRVLGISTITNQALAPDESAIETNHAEVLEVGRQVAPRFETLVRGVLRALAPSLTT